MPDRPRKSSTQVTLVLLAALASCNAPEPARRAYATKEACIADWGDPQECEEQVATQTDGTRRSYYVRSGGWGGGWGSASSRGARGGAHPGGTVRGGFGASGHAHGGGG